MTDWNIPNIDDALVDTLVAELDIRELTARCLAAREWGMGDATRQFLQPRLSQLREPSKLPDFGLAIERISEALRAGETVGIFGDYDVDGVTTAATMTRFLTDVGGKCASRVARRDDGYGFGVVDLRFLLDRDCTLIITGDCGTSDIETLLQARQAGVDVIVLDHHTVPTTDHHEAYALVNPMRPDSEFAFRGMASAGLAFYLMAGLRTHLSKTGYFRERPAPDVRELLDLTALGTVADLVPLEAENRILTRAGLSMLSARKRPGVVALAKIAGIDPTETIDERAIAWRLAPRLNAPGRLGDAAPALNLLLAQDDDTAHYWAAQVEECNQTRRHEQARVLDEVDEVLGDREPGAAVVVAGEGWAPGVVGIVAARLVDRYQRPAFVASLDSAGGEARGSARSYGGVNLYKALTACENWLGRYGGHAAAAGFSFEPSKLPLIERGLCAAVEELQADIEQESTPTADVEVHLQQLTEASVNELSRLAPFGKGNEELRFVARDLRIFDCRVVGDGNHLKLVFQDERGVQRSGIGFGLAKNNPGTNARVNVLFTPRLSTWRGQTRVEMEVHAIEATEYLSVDLPEALMERASEAEHVAEL